MGLDEGVSKAGPTDKIRVQDIQVMPQRPQDSPQSLTMSCSPSQSLRQAPRTHRSLLHCLLLSVLKCLSLWPTVAAQMTRREAEARWRSAQQAGALLGSLPTPSPGPGSQKAPTK